MPPPHINMLELFAGAESLLKLFTESTSKYIITMGDKMFNRIKSRLANAKYIVLAIATTIVTIGQTIDTSQMTSMITSMIPLIISMISIAIPLIFIKYIMRFLEKILGGFGD